MSFESREASFLTMLTSAQAVVDTANIRISVMNQVTQANTDAWNAAYAKAKADNPNLPPAVWDRIANEAVPPPTEEQQQGILEDGNDGTDVAGNDPTDVMGGELVDALNAVGGRVADPDIGRGQLGDGEMFMTDPTDDNRPPRQFIIPDTLSANQTETIRVALGIGGNQDEEEPYQKQQIIPIQETDPYIRTPEQYRVGGDEAREFTRRFGGTAMRTDEQRHYPTNDAMDQNEIDFINRAQPGSPLEGIKGPIGPTYRDSDVLDMISNMSTAKIIEFQKLAADAGFYGAAKRPSIAGHMSTADQNILFTAMGQANVSGEEVWPMMEAFATWGRSVKTSTARVKEPFSVPAHLRSIPGEKTVAEEAKARFRQQMGRDMRPEELSGVANELSGYYTKSNQEEIALYLAAYNGDNQGLLTGAQMQRIEEPGAATSFDIGEKWASEIDLNKRRESNADTFQRMLAATMGNRPSVGNLTAARGVQTIGRQ